MVILNRVAAVFREAGQYDEEQQALVAMRWAHRRLMILTGAPLKWPLHLGMAYAEWLLASFAHFMLAMLGWLGAITVVWWIRCGSLPIAIGRTVNSFFGGNPMDEEKFSHPAVLLSSVVVAVGIFHIGVFISYIYSLISRR